MPHGLQIVLSLPGQAPGGLPFLDDLIAGGPYAIIAVLIMVVRHLNKKKDEIEAELRAEIKDANNRLQISEHGHSSDKQALNDKILSVSQETTKAVIEVTSVQRELVTLIRQAQQQQQQEP